MRLVYLTTGTGSFYCGSCMRDNALVLALRKRGHDALLVPIMRDLYGLMAELATLPENREKLQPGMSSVTEAMVDALERTIDDLDEQFEHPTEFVVPGGDVVAAWLDLGRTVVRRAERLALRAAEPPSLVVPYLNRLSDLLWTMARWHEGTSMIAKDR